jgi:nitrite reductase/ring-hydroxylating ferredoxin subunit
MPAVLVATKAAVPPGTMKAFAADGAEVLVANCDGAFYAVSNSCTHRGGHLSNGKLDGFVVECPLHGARFDVRTGVNVAPPDLGSPEIALPDLKAYPVAVEGDDLKVTIT